MELIPTMTKEQSELWARSIVRDHPWLSDGWPTPEEVESFYKTELGIQIAACFAENERHRITEKTSCR